MLGLTQDQLYAFVDWGELYTRATAFAPSSMMDGASAGVGIRLGWINQVTADLSFAQAIQGQGSDRRFFFIISARY